MGEEQSKPKGAFLASLRKNVFAAVAAIGSVGVSAGIVLRAGTDYQDTKTKVEANREQIDLLRAELRSFESSLLFLLGQPRKAQP